MSLDTQACILTDPHQSSTPTAPPIRCITSDVDSAYNTDATVSPSSTGELSLVEAPRPATGTDDRHTEYIKLVGLPYNTSVTALKGFITDVKLYPVGKTIVRLKNATSGDSGKAMIRTESEAEARRCASLLHKRYLGWRYVEVYHIGEFEARSHNLPLDCDKPVTTKSKKQQKRSKAKVNAAKAAATCKSPTTEGSAAESVCTDRTVSITSVSNVPMYAYMDSVNSNYTHYTRYVNSLPFPQPVVQRTLVSRHCEPSNIQTRFHGNVGYDDGVRSKPQKSGVFVHSPYFIVENSMAPIESE